MTNSTEIIESSGGKIAATHTPVSTTVAKAIGILDILALTADSGISLTELSSQIEMVAMADNASSAREMKKTKNPNLILLDIWMPDTDGITLLKEWVADNTMLCPVVIMSGHGSVESAVEATRLGAYDFLEKPLSLERVLLVSQRALEKTTLEMENKTLRQDRTKKWRLVGNSPKMIHLREQIEMAAKSNGRVLILGESGSGKELLAHLLHEHSSSVEKPLVEMNCSAVPDTLAESELFGHERGAFTDARSTRIGLFEAANGGTLFLDVRSPCECGQETTRNVTALCDSFMN